MRVLVGLSGGLDHPPWASYTCFLVASHRPCWLRSINVSFSSVAFQFVFESAAPLCGAFVPGSRFSRACMVFNIVLSWLCSGLPLCGTCASDIAVLHRFLARLNAAIGTLIA